MDHFPITEDAKLGSEPGQLVNRRLKELQSLLALRGRDQKKWEGIDKVVKRTISKFYQNELSLYLPAYQPH